MRFRLPLGDRYYDYHILREIAFLIYPLSYWRHSLVRKFLKFASTFKYVPDNILEVGCGNGFFTKILSYRFPQSLITSIDTSTKSIAHAQKRRLPNVTFKKQNFFDITGKYDLIVSLHVFILLDPDNAFFKIRNLLAKRGVAFITYSGKTLFTELHRRFYKVVVGDEIEFKNRQKLINKAKESGLLPEVIEINSGEGSFALILKKSDNSQNSKEM